jgi:hypothetical protein
MKAPAVLWRWRPRNVKKRGGWEVLSWAMTEAHAAEWARNSKVEHTVWCAEEALLTSRGNYVP